MKIGNVSKDIKLHRLVFKYIFEKIKKQETCPKTKKIEIEHFRDSRLLKLLANIPIFRSGNRGSDFLSVIKVGGILLAVVLVPLVIQMFGGWRYLATFKLDNLLSYYRMMIYFIVFPYIGWSVGIVYWIICGFVSLVLYLSSFLALFLFHILFIHVSGNALRAFYTHTRNSFVVPFQQSVYMSKELLNGRVYYATRNELAAYYNESGQKRNAFNRKVFNRKVFNWKVFNSMSSSAYMVLSDGKVNGGTLMNLFGLRRKAKVCKTYEFVIFGQKGVGKTTLLCALKLGQPPEVSGVLMDFSDEIYTRVSGMRPTVPKELLDSEYIFFINEPRTRCLFFRDTAGEVIERRDLLSYLTRADRLYPCISWDVFADHDLSDDNIKELLYLKTSISSINAARRRAGITELTTFPLIILQTHRLKPGNQYIQEFEKIDETDAGRIEKIFERTKILELRFDPIYVFGDNLINNKDLDRRISFYNNFIEDLIAGIRTG